MFSSEAVKPSVNMATPSLSQRFRTRSPNKFIKGYKEKLKMNRNNNKNSISIDLLQNLFKNKKYGGFGVRWLDPIEMIGELLMLFYLFVLFIIIIG